MAYDQINSRTPEPKPGEGARLHAPDTAAAVQAGIDAATGHDRLIEFYIDGRADAEDHEEALPLIVLNAGQKAEVPEALILALESRRLAPRRKTGAVVAHDVPSFAELVGRWKTAQSMIYASPEDASLTAVLNDHFEEALENGGAVSTAGWCDHRIRYTCRKSDKWNLWTEAATNPYSQIAFSEFLERYFEDLVPSEHGTPADLLSLARQLEVQQKGTYVRRLDPVTGTRDLVWKNEIEAKCETMALPAGFSVGIPVFEGGKLYEVACKMRFSLGEGRPIFRFEIHRQADILKDAFAELVEETKKIGCPVVLATAPPLSAP